MPTRKRTSSHSRRSTATYFDEFTRLAYAQHESLLLQQLCAGDTVASHRVLKAELEHFLHPDTTHLHHKIRGYKNTEDLCHFLKTNHKGRRGLIKQFTTSFNHGISMFYHALFAWLLSSHYFAVCVDAIRRDNYDPLFQQLYFVVHDTGSKTSKNTTPTLTREFLRVAEDVFGTEFVLVKTAQYLTRIRVRYTDYARQLAFMIQRKGFVFDDMFSERNPVYLIADSMRTQEARTMLRMAKAKVDAIVFRSRALERAIKDHADFTKQIKEFRVLQDKRRKEMEETTQRRLKVQALQQRNNIENLKVLLMAKQLQQNM